MGRLGVWAYSFSTGELVWSSGIHRLLGTDPAIDRPSLETSLRNVHQDDRKKLLDAYELSRQRIVPDQQFRVIHPNGFLRWLTSCAEIQYSKDGSPFQIAGLLVDITDQKSFLELFRRKERRQNTLADSFNFSFWSADNNGALTGVQQWRSCISLPSKVLGWKWLQFVSESERDEVKRTWQQAVTVGKPHVSSFNLVISPPENIEVLVYAAPIIDDDGRILEWTGIVVRLHSASHASFSVREIKAAHIRAARALLNWSIGDLAKNSGVSVSSIRRFEGGEAPSIREHTLHAIEVALEKGGVEFNSCGGKLSIKLRA